MSLAANVYYEPALLRMHHNTWPVVNYPYNNKLNFLPYVHNNIQLHVFKYVNIYIQGNLVQIITCMA